LPGTNTKLVLICTTVPRGFPSGFAWSYFLGRRIVIRRHVILFNSRYKLHGPNKCTIGPSVHGIGM
jgi:hypothetical protein